MLSSLSSPAQSLLSCASSGKPFSDIHSRLTFLLSQSLHLVFPPSCFCHRDPQIRSFSQTHSLSEVGDMSSYLPTSPALQLSPGRGTFSPHRRALCVLRDTDSILLTLDIHEGNLPFVKTHRTWVSLTIDSKKDNRKEWGPSPKVDFPLSSP